MATTKKPAAKKPVAKKPAPAKKAARAEVPSEYFGNLYKIWITRVPEGQDFGEPISAVTDTIDSPVFFVGIIHTQKDGDDFFLAYSEEKIIAENTELDILIHDVLKITTKRIKLSKSEISELSGMLNIQDDADYQLDEDFWTYSLGEGGELLLNEKFVGGIVVNVDPYYSCIIKLEGAYAEVDFNAVSDEHEFCGVLVINDEEEDE